MMGMMTAMMVSGTKESSNITKENYYWNKRHINIDTIGLLWQN